MGSEPRYPSVNNVLAKKENANTRVLTWSNSSMSAGPSADNRWARSKLPNARAETTTEVDHDGFQAIGGGHRCRRQALRLSPGCRRPADLPCHRRVHAEVLRHRRQAV